MVKKSSKLANEPKTDPETAPTHLLPVTGGKAAYTTIKHREKSAYEEFVGPWTAMALSAVYEIACNDDLTTVREIKVYLYIISKIQNGNFAEVAQKHIAADTKIAATHVSTAIKSLISRGMISRHETNILLTSHTPTVGRIRRRISTRSCALPNTAT